MTNGTASETNGIASDAPLLACPLCGKKVSIARTENEQGERWWFITRGTYRTTRCDCRLFLESEKFTCGWNDAHALECRRKLVVRWNTRAAVTDRDFAMAVHDGELWRRVKNHVRCLECGLNIESLIPLESACNRHAVKYCPNCGADVPPYGEVNAQAMRIRELESLVRDWAMAPCAVCDPWDEHFACEHFDGHDCMLGVRMTELGMEVDA